MDLDLDTTQADVVGALGTLLARRAGAERARALGGRTHDDELLAALADAGFLDLFTDADAGPLLACLVAEEIAASAGQVNAGARCLVAPALLGAEAPARVALGTAGDELVRFGADADLVLVSDGDEARVVEPVVVEVVDGAFFTPYARMDLSGGRSLGPGSGEVLRNWWRVAIATQTAGALTAGLALTVRHLTDRTQFGRPLASFQALQHRLAEAYVTAQEVRWLARTAAADGAPAELSRIAAASAAAAAEELVPDLHQLSGAIGFTLEYDLHVWTLPLLALGLELGGTDAHLAGVAAVRWAG